MSKFMAWIDERLPVSNFVKNHLSQYYAPKNFNFFQFSPCTRYFVILGPGYLTLTTRKFRLPPGYWDSQNRHLDWAQDGPNFEPMRLGPSPMMTCHS